MIRQLYVMCGRLVSPLFIFGLHLYTLLTGTERARILVINEHDEVLLVRGVISDGKWTLPGGGIARREKAVAAALRELHEETGIRASVKDIKYLTTLSRPEIKVSYKAPLFFLKVSHAALPSKPVNTWEIADISWFKRTALPSPLSLLAHAAITTYYPHHRT